MDFGFRMDFGLVLQSGLAKIHLAKSQNPQIPDRWILASGWILAVVGLCIEYW